MVRIGLVIVALPSGGREIVVNILQNYLSKKGNEVTVIANDEFFEWEIPMNCEYIKLGCINNIDFVINNVLGSSSIPDFFKSNLFVPFWRELYFEKNRQIILNKIKEKTSMVTSVFKKTDKDVRSLRDTMKGEVEGKTPPLPKTNRDEKRTEKTVSGRFDIKTGKGYINDQEVALDEYEKFANMSMKEKVNQYGQVKENPQYNVGGYVTRDGEVHQGEYVVKESIVKKVGVTSIENVIKTMMQTSTTNIKQNPLKVISIMEGMSKQFAPIGEQLPEMINETIKELMYQTLKFFIL